MGGGEARGGGRARERALAATRLAYIPVSPGPRPRLRCSPPAARLPSMVRFFLSLPLTLAAVGPLPPASAQAVPQNMVVVLADDLGVDELALYGQGSDPAPTPWIDVLAGFGVTFSEAYANPTCSPTRAQIQTGRHGFRTGIGWVTHGGGPELPLEEVTLAEALKTLVPVPRACAVTGKWHLSNNLGTFGSHPLLQGYDHHAGSISNLDGPGQGYYGWPKFTDGVAGFSTDYATSDSVTSALNWLDQAPEPWLLVVSFNAPHAPYEYPPPFLHTQVEPPGATPAQQQRTKYKAMVQAIDTEIGRLVAGIPLEQLFRTLWVFAGDNGTPGEVIQPPFDPDHGKLTLYDGGCHVPLIVSHPLLGEKGKVCDRLVQLTDVFPTLLAIAGGDVEAFESQSGKKLDGISLVPYLKQVTAPPIRATAFSELFKPNGFQPTFTSYGIRDRRHRMIVNGHDGSIELYDLWTDPFEQVDLMLGPLSQEQLAVLGVLQGELLAIIQS